MSNFNKILNVVVPEVLQSLTAENDIFKVSFEAGRYHKEENRIVEKTLCTCVSADINLINKLTSSKISFRRDLLYLPVMTEMGFKVGNSHKQVLDLYDKAKGWYLHRGHKVEAEKKDISEEYINEDIPVTASVMKFLPLSGRVLTFEFDDGKIMVTTSTKNKCTIGQLLKAMTGKTYKELINILGSNMYILSSLSREDELSFSDSVSKTVPLFLQNKTGRDINNQAKTIQRSIFSKEYMAVNKASRIRLATATSFTKRALGCELVEDIEVDGEIISEGIELQRSLLERIDCSNITKLKVKKNGKVYDLRKYSHAEDCLTPDELYTMVNMYACLLDGFENFDEEYELTSRVLNSFEKAVREKITEKVGDVITDIANKLDYDSALNDISLFNVARSITVSDLLDLVKLLTNAASKETQMADNSNPISFESKNSKITTAIEGKAPQEMVRIQDTQRGHIDPIESPESSKIGKVHYKTVVAKTDVNGFSTAPYIKVSNGEVLDGEPVFLTADDTRYEYVAEWNEKFENNEISVFYNGSIIKAPKNKVKLMGYSPFDEMGLARSGIPFQNFSNPKRLLMGSNYERQADPIVHPERAIVSTGNEIFLPNLVYTARKLLAEYWEDVYSNNNSTGMTKEEFVESVVLLDNTKVITGKRIYTFVAKVKGTSVMFTKTLPFLQRTEKGSSFSYKLNPSKGKDDNYQGEDIVIYHGGIDITDYDIEFFADYGHYKITDEITGKLRPIEAKDLKYGLALGRNLTVGFKTFESSNIDDAITIRLGLVYENKLTSILQKEVKEECATSEDFYESFGFADSKKPKENYMQPNGLPKVGTLLKPGDLVIAKYKVVEDGGQDTVFVRNHYLPNNVSGEVVSAVLDNNTKQATVTLAYLSQAEEGDKLVGRYGNKGVISRIVKDSDMPYDAITGKPLDICLNPLGVPSRMNISQLLENVLGQCMVNKGKISIVTPFKENTMEYITDECNKADVHPRKLIDGRTGLPLDRPVNVGVMYMLKLEHMVNKKIHSVNITNSINPITKQPNQGAKRDGGQAFGEMEVWCLQACNANKVIQDIMTVQSDDIKAQKEFKELVESNPYDIDVKCTNNNDKYFMVMMRSMCANVVNSETDYTVRPLTDEDCRALSPNPVDSENIDTIYNNDYFGTPNRIKKRGTLEKTQEDMWSYVELHCKIVHPLWIEKSKLNQMLLIGEEQGENIKIRPINKDGLKKLIDGTAYLRFNEGNIPLYYKGSANRDGSVTGMEALVKLIEGTSLNDVKAYYQREVDKLKAVEAETGETKNYFSELVTITAINKWEELGIKLTDFIITTLPIMPNTFRPRIKSGMRRKFFANQHYGRIFAAICEVANANNNTNVYNVYRTIGEFVGVVNPGGSKQDIQTVEEYYFGKGSDKHGVFREQILAKRQHMTGRSVINPNGRLTVDQVGVPILMAVEIWKLHLISKLKAHSPLTENGHLLEDKECSVLLDAISSGNDRKFCRLLGIDCDSRTNRQLFFNTRKFVIEFLEEQHALFGRQPSLAKFSCRAYEVVVTFHKTLELNPLVCKGYNADFDGDQMYLLGLMTTEASDEAWEKMAAKNWVINPKDSSNIMEHQQDIVLGTYYATMLFDNVKDIREDARYNSVFYVESLDELKDQIEVGNLHVHSLVSIRIEGKMYLSTAGRILFNGLIPGGFTDEPFTNNLRLPVIGDTQVVNENAKAKQLPVINPSRYYNLKLDGLISAKGKSKDGMVYYSLSEYTKQLYYDTDIETCMKTYQSILEYGFHFCDVSGLSIGVEDLQIKMDLQTPINEVNDLAEKINKAYFNGLLSETGRKSMLINVYNQLTKHLKDEVVFKNLPRNNNIAIILDSGSRGNIDQVMQTIGIIGVSMKTNSESLETPILHAYGSGLTSFEMFLASYGARMGINSTQNETADAGYATRKTVYMSNGLRIVEEDCENEEDDFYIDYTELAKITDNNGNFWDDSHLEVVKGSKEELTTLTDILQGKQLASCPENEFSRKVLLNFLPLSEKLNDSSIKQLVKHKVKNLVCFDSNEELVNYELHYEMNETSKDDMLYRYLSSDVENPSTGKVIIKAGTYLDEEHIKAIGELNLEHIRLRTMLSCRSINGVCAKCFGKKFDTLTLPKVGEYIGVESAQAIGEPAAQLSMNVSHKGGIAAGATRGVRYFASLLSGSVPNMDLHAITSSEAQYVDIKILGDNAQVTNGNRIISVPTATLLVENGEYVEFGDMLTAGNIVLNKMGNARNNVGVIRKRQMTLLEMYHSTFLTNNLDVHARHFEVLVRLQTTLVQVIESDDPDIITGQDAELAQVLKSQANGHEISFDFATTKQPRVISYFGGTFTGLAFERFDEVLTNSIVSQPNNPNIGILSKIVVGEDVRNQYDDAGNILPSKRKEIVQGYNTVIDANEMNSFGGNKCNDDVYEEVDVSVTNANLGVSATESEDGELTFEFNEQSLDGENSSIELDEIFNDFDITALEVDEDIKPKTETTEDTSLEIDTKSMGLF